MAEIRGELRGNAVVYSRVSTKHDDQVDSLENQRTLAELFLKEHSSVTVVGYYSDQESGKTTERKDYLKMLNRIAEGDVRYIIAKNSTRLSRSSEVSGALNRMCEKFNCKIIFTSEKTVYDPSDRSDRLLNSIKAAIAEDYVYNQSEQGKIAHMLKCKDKRLSVQNEVYGYRFNKETKQMEIVPEEASVVKLIFEWYVFQNKGVAQIGQDLAKMGILGKRSGKVLTARTITERLRCTAYMGKMAFHKSQNKLITGVGAKSIRIKLPEGEWVYADCPAIISEELFTLAQLVREERTRVFKTRENADKKTTAQARFRGTHLFSTKVFCAVCGNSYQHGYYNRNKSVSYYRDSFRQKGYTPETKCTNKTYGKIFEEQLVEATILAINTFIENRTDIFDNAVRILREVLNEPKDTEGEEGLTITLEKAQEDKRKWLEAYKNAVATGIQELIDECLQSYNKAAETVKTMESMLHSSETKRNSMHEIEERLAMIEQRVTELKHFDTLTRDDVLTFVDKIVIHPDGKIHIILSFAETYSYQLDTFEEYKKTLEKGSSFSFTLFPSINDVVSFYTAAESHDAMGASDIELVCKDKTACKFYIPVFRMYYDSVNNICSKHSRSKFLNQRKNHMDITVIFKLSIGYNHNTQKIK